MPVGLYTGAQVSNGNGVTTLFPYGWKILDQTHIEVKVDGVVKVLGADYSVTGVGASNGGNVVFLVAPANGTVVQRARKVPYKRDTDYQANGDFKEETVDSDFDLEEMQVQQLALDIARAFKAPLSVTADQVLTDAQWAARASMLLGFDAGGAFGVFAALNQALVSAFMTTVLDDPDAATAANTLAVIAKAIGTTKGDIIGFTGAGVPVRRGVGANGKALVAASAQADGLTWDFINHGQCQLVKNGANLQLTPFNGNKLIINGAVEAVPDAGVLLAPPAVASTTYYIYAFMNAGVMTLENVATVPAVQAGTGVKIKNGDATRTLVGQARTTAGNAWADSATQRFVRSWFNDPGLACLNTFTADRSTGSATYVEMNSEIRCEFLVWTGEIVRAAFNGSTQQAATTGGMCTAVGYDGTAAEPGSEVACVEYVAANDNILSGSSFKTGLAEGYHYATLLGRGSGTTVWASASTTARAKTYLHVNVGQGTP